jgi:hypothetical protein
MAELDLRIHTNCVQLSPRYLDLFDEFGVKVGISLDGDRVVVETDGTLEQVESLKTAYEGTTATAFDIFNSSFDEVAAPPQSVVGVVGCPSHFTCSVPAVPFRHTMLLRRPARACPAAGVTEPGPCGASRSRFGDTGAGPPR